MKRILALLLAASLLALLTGCAASQPDEETVPPGAIHQFDLVPADTVPPEDQAPETSAAETAAAPETTAPAVETHFLLTFVGDCTLGSNPFNYYADYGFIKTVGEDYAYPFANVLSYFEGDDCSFVNLEGPLADGGNPMQKKHAFRGPTDYINILTGSSVEFVSLGNNHTMDYQASGYESTLAALKGADLPYVERDKYTVFTTESGLTIGVYAMVYYLLDVEDMTQAIQQMREQNVDLIIVAPHWGIEGTFQPSQQQVDVGHAAIDAGADFVWGSHPHVLQPIEEYNGGVICYSLGNFCFGGNIYPKDLDSAIIQQEFIKDGSGQVHFGERTIIPVSVSSIPDRNNFQPTPYAPGSEEYDRVISKLDGTYDGPRLSID